MDSNDSWWIRGKGINLKDWNVTHQTFWVLFVRLFFKKQPFLKRNVKHFLLPVIFVLFWIKINILCKAQYQSRIHRIQMRRTLMPILQKPRLKTSPKLGNKSCLTSEYSSSHFWPWSGTFVVLLLQVTESWVENFYMQNLNQRSCSGKCTYNTT